MMPRPRSATTTRTRGQPPLEAHGPLRPAMHQLHAPAAAAALPAAAPAWQLKPCLDVRFIRFRRAFLPPAAACTTERARVSSVVGMAPAPGLARHSARALQREGCAAEPLAAALPASAAWLAAETAPFSLHYLILQTTTCGMWSASMRRQPRMPPHAASEGRQELPVRQLQAAPRPAPAWSRAGAAPP